MASGPVKGIYIQCKCFKLSNKSFLRGTYAYPFNNGYLRFISSWAFFSSISNLF